MNSEILLSTGKITVNQWFCQWIEMLRGYRKPKTITNYTNYYNNCIRNIIGQMDISDVKPMHCSLVLQSMMENYKPSSIKQVRVAMSSMFQYALDNDIILKNPVGKSVTIPYTALSYSNDERHLFLTPTETNLFLNTAARSSYYLQYSLVLETGLRASELIGLTLDEIDTNENIIHIKHTLLYDENRRWYFITPKSKQGIRDIYMTPKCREIITKALQARKHYAKAALPPYDNLLFLSRQSMPIRISSYNMGLYRICNRAGIKPISMHALRHTFATRCANAGITPKVLQTLMGHSDISTTMNIYVHVSEASKREEMEKLAVYEKNLGL